MCSLRRPLLPKPLHEVPLHELLQDYGYEHAGQRIPLLTFTEFVQRLGQDDRVRFFFLISKFLRITPTCAPRSSGTPCRPCSTIALDKAVFLTPYETIFHQLRHEAQRLHQTTHTRVDIAFDTEGPELIQLSAWPSAVQRAHSG